MQPGHRSFTITHCLGRGGFGEVYRAHMLRDGGLDTDVALKVLRRDIDPDGQAVQRLRDEGRLLARLNHPAILKVHDLVVLDGRIALVTEYVDGDDLSTCLRGETPIPTRALLEAIAVVAGALATAWEAPGRDGPLRLVHRDIKPSNLRLSRHGEVKLLDFGIARSDAEGVERESRTRTGMMVGSPAYMAPERFTERTVHLGSDVFSLCAILFEGLTGERFYGDLPVPMQVGLAVDEERYAVHLGRQLERVEAGPLRTLLSKGLAHRVQGRPSPHDLARRLDALAEDWEGSNLARYARARRWSDGHSITGELDGQTLSETRSSKTPVPAPSSVETLAQPLPLPPTVALGVPVTPAPPPRRRWRWVLGGLGVLGSMAGVLVLLTGGLAVLPFVLGGAGDAELARDGSANLLPVDPSAAPEPVPRPAPASAPGSIATATPPAAPPSAPRPPPSSTPVAPSPDAPSTAPPSAAPAPGQAPPPDPVVATGRVALSGGVAALLQGPSGRHRLPGAVPVGTYRLLALFNGLDAVDVASVTVAEGATMRVDCSARFTRCTVK